MTNTFPIVYFTGYNANLKEIEEYIFSMIHPMRDIFSIALPMNMSVINMFTHWILFFYDTFNGRHHYYV